ncbi:MAG: ATP-binding protein, partial [Alphaproteobacteria bacterium]
MPETRSVIPHPVSLIESMRSVGYTLEAAVADIVDNSISAGAEHISILYDASGEPYVSVLDDGSGMTEGELLDAMRHGSSSPNDPRAAQDLGRFG